MEHGLDGGYGERRLRGRREAGGGGTAWELRQGGEKNSGVGMKQSSHGYGVWVIVVMNKTEFGIEVRALRARW
ncbi:hypothetical protein M0R45_035891 [Rubus argutus]|uniref:Uncharacterized protein n=1 Tax=Rubus argutus TaxID=59490 RepID=A0AAW1VVF1_RUBAR